MKFTDKDKEFLLEKVYGGIEQTFKEDLPQIEEAADVTNYSLIRYEEDNWRGKYTKHSISKTDAIKLVGREGWLLGLARSAFHWTACRQLSDKRSEVSFDSKKLFRQGATPMNKYNKGMFIGAAAMVVCAGGSPEVHP